MKIRRFFILLLLAVCVHTATFAQHEANAQRDNYTVWVALLLPFTSEDGGQNATTNRMVEYYEGVLLAMEDLKRMGISVDLQVADIGSSDRRLQSILLSDDLKEVDLVIGGLSDKHTQSISAFCNRYNIPYVIPFTSQNNAVLKYPKVYQVNMSQAEIYPRASAAFCEKYRDANVVLCRDMALKGNKTDFCTQLEVDLKLNNIAYASVDVNYLFENLKTSLVADRLNIIVPDDDSELRLELMSQPLKLFAGVYPDYQISLFGYPTWQTLASNTLLYQFNATFYSVYYANLTSPAVKKFQTNFQHWYSRNLIATFPKYGMLGYDTGMYFVQLLDAFGIAIGKNINNINYSGIQTNFMFEPVGAKGGFINNSLFFVEYMPDRNVFVSSVQ